MIIPAKPSSGLFMLPSFEAGALFRYLEVMERFIYELEATVPRPAPNFLMDMHRSYVQNRLPHQLRGAYLTALWALYESSVVEIARHLGPRVSSGGQEFLPGRDLIGSLDNYFRTTVGIARVASRDERRALERLYRMRNEFAHNSGREPPQGSSRYEGLEAERRTHGGFEFAGGMIELSPDYIFQQFYLVRDSLSALTERARARYDVAVASKHTPGSTA